MNQARPKRLLIVEDSAVVRELLVYICKGDPRLEVVQVVESAEAALQYLNRNQVDIISLDIELPRMNGLELCQEIMWQFPTPIVIVSSYLSDKETKYSLNALKAGALDVIAKPPGPSDPSYPKFARDFTNLLVIMSDVKVISQKQRVLKKADKEENENSTQKSRTPIRALGVGASTGGPQAVVQLFKQLPIGGFDFPVFLVQHITAEFLTSYVEWLSETTAKTIRIAKHHEKPLPGIVYHPPSDCHLEVVHGIIHLSEKQPVSFQRPSITVLFESMARSYGSECIGVLLTGMGDDGALGLAQIKQRGGMTIAEHESTTIVYGMPKAAVDMGATVEVLPLPEIAPCICRWLGKD